MNTKYSELQKDEDYILLDPVSKNDVEMGGEPANESSTTRVSYYYSVPPRLLHYSMQYKLRNQRTRPKFQVLQKWEGIVEEINGDTILVKLIDLTNGGTHEETELDLQDISPDDIQLVKKGAMFYWSIGYETQRDRQVKKSSFIKFKRLPKLDPSQFDVIHDRARQLEDQILLD